MLRRDRVVRMQIHQLMDACIFAFSFWLAYTLRSSEWLRDFFHLNPVPLFDKYAWLYLILIPMAPMVLESQGFYTRPLICPRRLTLWTLFKACAIISFSLIIASFIYRTDPPIARWVVVWFGALSLLLLFFKEEAMRLATKNRLSQAQFQRRFLLVGTPEETARMRQNLREYNLREMLVAGEMDLNTQPVRKLVEMLHEHSVYGVILSPQRTYMEQVEAAVQSCELEGVEVWLTANFFRTHISRTSVDEFCGRPVLVFRSTPEASWQALAKQLIDLVGGLLLLLIWSPILIPVAILIKLTSPGPILFRQQRSGISGRPFTIYKFRTMVTNAEQLKHELEQLNEMTGPVFKITKDPRVTPLGRFLRKYSLDEFPQLINVIKGEMSLVGPRPLPVDEVRRFDDLAHRRRLSVKPGLTCLWQISGRNNLTDFKEWVRLDLQYIDNWSIWLDLKILLHTIPVVLRGTGAK